MAYESAGIRFTEGGKGPGAGESRGTSPVQEAIQLLRLRVPKFSGAPPPAIPPGLMAGGPGGPPDDIMRKLQMLFSAMMGPQAPSAPNAPSFGQQRTSAPFNPMSAVAGGQTFGQPFQNATGFPLPSFIPGYNPPPAEPPPVPGTGPAPPVPPPPPPPTNGLVMGEANPNEPIASGPDFYYRG
jgi:hypothetical protein